MSLIFFLLLSGVEEYTPFGDPGIERSLDPADWDGTVTARLEVHGKTSLGSRPLKARLYNVTTGAAVAGSDINSAALTKTRARSGSFSLAAGANVYRVEFGGTPGATFTLYDAVLLLDVA